MERRLLNTTIGIPLRSMHEYDRLRSERRDGDWEGREVNRRRPAASLRRHCVLRGAGLHAWGCSGGFGDFARRVLLVAGQAAHP